MSAKGMKIYRIKLGQIGRFGEGEEQEVLNKNLTELIPVLERLLKEGKIQPLEYHVVNEGLENVVEAVKYHDSGKLRGKKGLVKIAV